MLANRAGTKRGWWRLAVEPRLKGLAALRHETCRRGLQNVRQRGIRWAAVLGNLCRQVLWPQAVQARFEPPALR